MVRGIFSASKADYAFAVSGVAGPAGGTAEKPVGTVWGAIGERGGQVFTGLIPHRSGMPREMIIKRSSQYLFGALWRYIAYEITPFT